MGTAEPPDEPPEAPARRGLPVAGPPWDRLGADPPQAFPAAMLNVTNRCNLSCAHCFVYTDGKPKERYPRFVWNHRRALALMRPNAARVVTAHCPALATVLPLYVERGRFTNPRCCYGNHADCDRCGAWVVFAHAAKLPGPWDEIVAPTDPPGPLAHWFAAAGARLP